MQIVKSIESDKNAIEAAQIHQKPIKNATWQKWDQNNFKVTANMKKNIDTEKFSFKSPDWKTMKNLPKFEND